MVATHSGNSEKLREFLNHRKSQWDSGNFDFFQIQGNLGKFWFFFNFREVLWFKKSQGKFFLDIEWDLVNLVPIYYLKNWFYLILNA